MVVTLTVLHKLILDDLQIQALRRGERIVVEGWCVPVWYFAGASSEPAKEVWCRYDLRLGNAENEPIRAGGEGWEVVLPSPEAKHGTAALLKKRREQDGTTPSPTIDALVDLDRGHLKMRLFSKMLHDGRRMNAVHVVEVTHRDLFDRSLLLGDPEVAAAIHGGGPRVELSPQAVTDNPAVPATSEAESTPTD